MKSFPRLARLSTPVAIALLLGCVAPAPVVDSRRSGFDFMGVQVQAMQRDDSSNPAMLSVQDGQALWSAPASGGKSCASCHAAAESSMRGVATRYPAWDAPLSRPVNLGTRINLCRERHQRLPALAADNQQLLSLEAYVAHQSRGMPIAPDADPRLTPFRERGGRLFAQRMGQLDLSCAQCHDQLAGGKLGGSVIPQGHATGYPLYRLEWQALGSLQRRLRGCMTGVRAEPFAAGSVEFVELELHLASRAMGMPLETPAVRP
jgi:sulfur-oxidizing protein SoxA